MTTPAKKRPAAVRGQTMPGSRADRILAFVNQSPGKRLRCYEIAQGIGEATQPTAHTCYRMWSRGQLDRWLTPEGNGTITHYSTPS